MNIFLKTTAAALAIAAVGFAATAQAEGEYQYVAPSSVSNNIVGGGSTVVVNTGDPSNSVRVVHTDDFGAQRLGRGQVAMIGGGQDDYQTVLVAPSTRPAGNPFTLLSSIFGGRSRS